MNKDNRGKENTTDGKEPTLPPDAPTPQPLDPKTGQYGAYWILSEAERKGGFVRPVRTKYIHVGIRPKYPTRELTPEEHQAYDHYGYVLHEAYPEGSPEANEGKTGRYWTAAMLKSGCGKATSMARELAETYAKQPDYYGGTFCFHCNDHLPVGADGEFTWEDGSRVGT